MTVKKLKYGGFSWDGKVMTVTVWIKTNSTNPEEPDVYSEEIKLNKVYLLSLMRFGLRVLTHGKGKTPSKK